MGAGRKHTLQHLQALQSLRPLDALPSSSSPGAAAEEPPPWLPEERLKEADAPGSAEDWAMLRKAVSTAQFWIALLEGERAQLAEEAARHRQRHQLAQRQAEDKTAALREADVERRRMAAQLRRLQQRSREQAPPDSARGLPPEPSAGQPLTGMQAELARERAEKEELERQLLRVKFVFAETLQKADSMECLIEHYEDMLRTLNPAFEPVDLAAMGWIRPPPPADLSEVESLTSGPSNHVAPQPEERPKAGGGGGAALLKELKGGISKVKHMFKHRRHSTSSGDHKLDLPLTPRSCSSRSPRGSQDALAGAAAAASAGGDGEPTTESSGGGGGGGMKDASPTSSPGWLRDRGVGDVGLSPTAGGDSTGNSGTSAVPSAAPSAAHSAAARTLKRWEMRQD